MEESPKWAAPISTGSAPKAFDRRMRRVPPPMLMWTIFADGLIVEDQFLAFHLPRRKLRGWRSAPRADPMRLGERSMREKNHGGRL